jgi:arginase
MEPSPTLASHCTSVRLIDRQPAGPRARCPTPQIAPNDPYGAPVSGLRRAGLIELLGGVGFEVSDLGDSPVVPWRPDRARPRAQNLEDVVHMVRRTSSRVADALDERDRTVHALGGDCTVGIGTIAGARSRLGDLAVAYFDLHSDLNTPTSARDGALDWMALAHMLAIEGAEPTLAAATGQVPLLEANQVVLFAHSRSDATRFERGEIERLGLARVGLEDVRGHPEEAARHALELLAARSDRYVIHLDVDVVDFTDAPLSEHPSRNTGLKLEEMLSARSSHPLRVSSQSRLPNSIRTTRPPTTDCWSTSLLRSPTRSAPPRSDNAARLRPADRGHAPDPDEHISRRHHVSGAAQHCCKQK